jgi:hypothetical protein
VEGFGAQRLEAAGRGDGSSGWDSLFASGTGAAEGDIVN